MRANRSFDSDTHRRGASSRARERTSCGASPARAETFKGLPPAYVLTAGADPLRDEGDEYAARLKDAGVAVKHITYPGQFHGFITMGKLLPKAGVALADIAAWLRALN